MNLQITSAKWWCFCFGIDELTNDELGVPWDGEKKQITLDMYGAAGQLVGDYLHQMCDERGT